MLFRLYLFELVLDPIIIQCGMWMHRIGLSYALVLLSIFQDLFLIFQRLLISIYYRNRIFVGVIPGKRSGIVLLSGKSLVSAN